jgi:hypothetical protein
VKSQLAFGLPAAFEMERDYPELLALLSSVASEIGRKQVCEELDITMSALSNMLRDRERHALKARFLLYFIRKDVRVLQWLAVFGGCEVARPKPLTPEQELARLKRKLRVEFGAAGERLIQEAKR